MVCVSGVLVTGASGFIGGHLSRRLVRAGAEVHGVSRRPREIEGVRWWQADLSDAAAAAELVRSVRPERIFHLAGLTSGSRDLDEVLPVLRDNLVATVGLLVEAARSDCELVLMAGSLEEPQGATGEFVPTSPYAAAKEAAGSFARMLAALHDLKVVNLRVFMTYGPGQRAPKIVPSVVGSLLRGERPKLTSGRRAVDWIHVDDVVDAFLAAADRPDLAGETLDVGSGELVTIRSLVELIVELMGSELEPEFGAIPDRPLETVRAADTERTRALLGWSPKTTLRSGLRATIGWCRAEAAELAVEEAAVER